MYYIQYFCRNVHVFFKNYYFYYRNLTLNNFGKKWIYPLNTFYIKINIFDMYFKLKTLLSNSLLNSLKHIISYYLIFKIIYFTAPANHYDTPAINHRRQRAEQQIDHSPSIAVFPVLRVLCDEPRTIRITLYSHLCTQTDGQTTGSWRRWRQHVKTTSR